MNTLRPETTSPLDEVCAFLLKHEPWLAGGPWGNVLEYVGWYWRDGRVGVVRDGATVLAVALARCVDEVEQAQMLSYYHKENGRLVWVDHIASVHPDGITLLLGIAMQRFGPREAFAGDVFTRAGELRMLPWKVVERMTANTHHGLSLNSRATCAA